MLRDYGKDPDDPFDGALHYQKFISGLATRRPSNQFLLFDACRSAANPQGGQAVFAADPEGRLGITKPMRQCPIFSTPLDGQARGRPNEESLCARGFIRAMSGACCKREGNSWYVTTDRIVEALSDFQNRELLKAKNQELLKAETKRGLARGTSKTSAARLMPTAPAKSRAAAITHSRAPAARAPRAAPRSRTAFFGR